MSEEDKALVERLRDYRLVFTQTLGLFPNQILSSAHNDAADRIEAQAAEIARLREALERIDNLQYGAEGYAKVITRIALGEQP